VRQLRVEFLAELFNEFPNLVVNVSHQGITLLRSHDQSGIINNFFPSDLHGLARIFNFPSMSLVLGFGVPSALRNPW
jgi:hypothetical protein